MKCEDTTSIQKQLIKDPIVLILMVSLLSMGILRFSNLIEFSDIVLAYIEKAFQLLLACTLGSFIGLEREYKQRPAGLRTFALVCLGSTLIMVVSFDIFDRYHEMANFDPARLGAQVVSGIGFLGAGTIIHSKTSVKGLTSAAGLWVVASIGLAIGAKMYIESIGYFLVVFFILHHINSMERRQLLKNKLVRFEIISKDISGIVGEVGKVFSNEKLKILSIDIEREEEDDYNENPVQITEAESVLPEEYMDTDNDVDVKIAITVQIPYGYDTKVLKKMIRVITGVGYVSVKKQNNDR